MSSNLKLPDKLFVVWLSQCVAAVDRRMHLTGGPTWLRSAIAEIKQ